ncbi:codanin-1 [Ostrinia nubilalis]|uniref:codanin-1 n=1 Tax=Ostrinia nubilalis TaxID=29057 RepID=UPI0030824BC4
MPDIIIESVLKGKLDCELLFKWLNNEEIEDPPEDCILFCCNRNEFVAYFLSYLRTQTESVLQTNSNAPPPLHQTPEKVLNPRRKHRRSISDPTSDDRKDTLSVKSTSLRSQESPSKDRKRTGRRVKTKLFDDSTISSDESRISTGMEKVFVSSTPMKSNSRSELPVTSPVTPLRSFMHERCDTPRLSHRHRSHEKSCLGDYLVGDFAQKSSKKKKGRNASDSSEPVELDLSNSDAFPEIGARKASSLRSDKRRIKPTNIDKSTSKKSVSLNSFNSDYFQQSSVSLLEDNAVFKQQSIQSKEASGFDAERSMLKQERHKLMEKFNILNTTASPKPVAPKIKVTQKESFEQAKTYIKSDSTKIVFKEKLDLLCDIYDILMNNNLILSVSTEIYFLISILLSKQCEEEYKTVESNLKDNNFEYLMKSIHNSTYFAVKCLWNMRTILEVVLDRNSLKILGENKKVRAFYPDLAKFLLNSYGLKCELEGGQQEKKSVERISNGVICFNHETDNVDNFPSVMSFQNFKKQRDMFYEIVRWYQETTASGGSLSSFRARIKTLLSCGQASANYAHLAALFTQHMLAECLPANTQESKLSKLQRRLTCPTNAESHRLPAFSTKETFYASFVRSADGFFRVHLQDAVANTLVSLDAAPGLTSHPDVSKDYHSLAKKLCLLGKFSGFVAALPYSLAPETARPAPHQPPRGRAAESEVAQRNHSKDYHSLAKKLCLLGKFSGFVAALPYNLAPETARPAPHQPPRGRAAESEVARRNHSKDYHSHSLAKKLCLLGKFSGFIAALPYSLAPETARPAPHQPPRGRAADSEVAQRNHSKDYHSLAKKLCLLGKFSGFVAALPYNLAPETARPAPHQPPRGRAAESEMAQRNHSKDYHTLAKKLCLLGKFSGFVAALPYNLAPETARPAPHQPPRGRAAESEVARRNHSKDYHSLAKKLCLLGKFSGFVAALPYNLAPETARPAPHQPPRGRAAESEVAQRNHSQPTLDLKGMLTSAYQTSRLIITVPWVVHYLSMLDYASLRITYYQELLKILRHIYINRLKTSETFLKKNTVIFLKCTLGWLFDLPQFPQDITCDNNPVISEVNIDCSEVIDEVILFDLCPYLRDVNVLLSTCKVSHDQKDVGTFRHITPVSLTLNPEDRLRNKERELQSRLEEEMLKSQPSSTRRVLELVTERVAAATVRELARPLATAREQVAARAARTVRERGGMTQVGNKLATNRH